MLLNSITLFGSFTCRKLQNCKQHLPHIGAPPSLITVPRLHAIATSNPIEYYALKFECAFLISHHSSMTLSGFFKGDDRSGAWNERQADPSA